MSRDAEQLLEIDPSVVDECGKERCFLLAARSALSGPVVLQAATRPSLKKKLTMVVGPWIVYGYALARCWGMTVIR